MTANRRDLLTGGPAALFDFNFSQLPQAQKPAASTSSMHDMGTIATSIFSAMFPAAGKGKAEAAGAKKASRPAPGAQTAAAPAAAVSAVPLQRAKQSQSLSLPTGFGKTSFACFAKDQRKTLFGQFVDVFAQLAASSMLSDLPMLSLPAVGVSTSDAVGSLVVNLPAPPLDVATTKDNAQKHPHALRLRAGSYIVVPEEHSDAMKTAQMDQLKPMDGFLAASDATVGVGVSKK